MRLFPESDEGAEIWMISPSRQENGRPPDTDSSRVRKMAGPFPLWKKKVISLILFTVLAFSLFSAGSAEALSGFSRMTSRNYLLSGDLTFEYRKDWGDDRNEERFTHEYNVVLDGFVVDPRLVKFELSGTFAQWLNDPGSDYSLYGFGTKLSFLNARVLRGPLRHFPRPIRLWFDFNKTSDFKSYTYGFSFDYTVPGNLTFFRKGKIFSFDRALPDGRAISIRNNGNGDNGNDRGGFVLPAPRLYVNYDSINYSFENSGRESREDIFNFRAESFTKNSEYRLEYRYDRTTETGRGADAGYKDQWIEVRADYHFPEPKTARTFDVYNRIFFRDVQDTSFWDLSSRGIWLKRLGADLVDSLSLTGGGRYVSSDRTSGYTTDLSSSYTRHFSERLRNTLTGSIAYNDYESESIAGLSVGSGESSYSASISDSISYELSRPLLVRGTLLAGISDSDPIYGFMLGLATRTRIATSAEYAYNHYGRDGEETDTHRITFNASTVLPKNVFFTTRNYYLITDVRTGEEERFLVLRGDIYWNPLPYRFNLGVNYQSLKRTTETSLTVETAATQIHATLSRLFSRRLFFAVRVVYSRIKSGDSFLEFDPSLSWSFRRVFLTARYTLRKTESKDQDSRTDHRFYFTMRRSFDITLRSFL